MGRIHPDEFRKHGACQLIVLRGRAGCCGDIGGAGEGRNGAKDGQIQGKFMNEPSRGHRPLQWLRHHGRMKLGYLVIAVAGDAWERHECLRWRLWVTSLGFQRVEIYATCSNLGIADVVYGRLKALLCRW